MALYLEGDWGTPVEREDFELGDYLVEVVEPKDPSKVLRESVDEATGEVRFRFLSFTLNVLAPVNYKDRFMFHSTMFWAADPVDKRGNRYDPRSMSYDFLAAIGAAEKIRKGGTTTYTIHPQHLDKNGNLDFLSLMGLRCWVQYGERKDANGESRYQVLKAWAE